MKKIAFLLILGVAVSSGTRAQSNDVKTDQKVLKNAVADKKEDKHEVGTDLAHLRIRSAQKERREVKRHSKSIRNQGKHLENHGQKNPIRKAKRQAKAEKDAKRGRD
jgi:hypothetical protein